LKSLLRFACASLAFVLAHLAGTRAAAAAPPHPGNGEEELLAPTALLTGFVIAGSSLAAGGYVVATDRSLTAKHNGLYVMHAGLTLAPLVAHAVADEWWRGALFSLPPALAGVGMVTLLAVTPEAPIKGKNKAQRIYPVLITVGVLGSALGIFDAVLVDERRAAARRSQTPSAASWRVTAAASPEFTGAVAYGSF